MANKWIEFANPEKYRLVDLGRPAVFLIPVSKLKQEIGRETTIEDHIDQFLLKKFGSFTKISFPSFGVWSKGEEVINDDCVQWKVSFSDKRKIPLLLAKLAEVAFLIGEECIYVEAGQYAALIYPSKK
ncbi:MAG: hypothetical protein Q7S32_02280 [bacterium]|nr:hypothetical protein [bacterium]